MTKLIKNEFELHQRANDTTKMLAYNILPVDIVTRYSFIILYLWKLMYMFRLASGSKISIVDHISSATIIFIGVANLYSCAYL